MKCLRKLFGLIPENESGWYVERHNKNVRLVSGRNREIVMSTQVYETVAGAVESSQRIARVTRLPLKVIE